MSYILNYDLQEIIALIPIAISDPTTIPESRNRVLQEVELIRSLGIDYLLRSIPENKRAKAIDDIFNVPDTSRDGQQAIQNSMFRLSSASRDLIVVSACLSLAEIGIPKRNEDMVSRRDTPGFSNILRSILISERHPGKLVTLGHDFILQVNTDQPSEEVMGELNDIIEDLPLEWTYNNGLLKLNMVVEREMNTPRTTISSGTIKSISWSILLHYLGVGTLDLIKRVSLLNNKVREIDEYRDNTYYLRRAFDQRPADSIEVDGVDVDGALPEHPGGDQGDESGTLRGADVRAELSTPGFGFFLQPSEPVSNP